VVVVIREWSRKKTPPALFVPVGKLRPSGSGMAGGWRIIRHALYQWQFASVKDCGANTALKLEGNLCFCNTNKHSTAGQATPAATVISPYIPLYRATIQRRHALS
jgi:hypothetical protein